MTIGLSLFLSAMLIKVDLRLLFNKLLFDNEC